VKLFSDYLNVCDQNPFTLQTDGRTNRQTTSHSNTAQRMYVVKRKGRNPLGKLVGN